MVSRRTCLKTLGGIAALSATGIPEITQAAETKSKAAPSKLAIPGLYRGRVVRVQGENSIANGIYHPETIRTMVRRGMTELTGAPDWVAAWKQFVGPGDVVGLKLNPVGAPHVISDASVVREVIAGLEAAGVRRQDIVVYDRYKDQFLAAGFDRWLPEGVRISHAAEKYDDIQQDITGYDPEHYIDLPLTLPGYVELGYTRGESLLTTPIASADDVAAWTDGIFNASVPLPAAMHTGVLPRGAGYHHYPKPIVDILTFKYDDFTLFVTDEHGQPMAVLPVSPRGAGDGRVAIAWAPPESDAGRAQLEAEHHGARAILPDTSEVAHRAYALQ